MTTWMITRRRVLILEKSGMIKKQVKFGLEVARAAS